MLTWLIIAFIAAGGAFGYLAYKAGWKGAVAAVSALGFAFYTAGDQVIDAIVAFAKAF